jgi:hypothetical protein
MEIIYELEDIASVAQQVVEIQSHFLWEMGAGKLLYQTIV